MKKKKERRVYLPRVLGSGQVMMPGRPKAEPLAFFLDNQRSVKSLTHLSRFLSLTSGSSTCRQEAKMAQDLGIILAVAVIVVAIMTWVAPPNPKSVSAGSIQPSEVIYRPQYLNLY